MSEGDTVSAEVKVMSGIMLDRSVIVTVQTVDGTATGMVVWLDVSRYEEDHSLDVQCASPITEAGNDYTSVSVDLTFSAGTTSQTVMIITSTDSIVENVETFTLSLTSTDSAVMPQSVSTTVSITDMTSEYIHSHSMVMSMTNMKETANAIGRAVADPLVIMAVMA